MSQPGPWEKPAAQRQSAGRSPIFNAPPVVISTIAVLAAFYVVTSFAPIGVREALTEGLALEPARLMRGPRASGGALSMLAPLFTHMLIHASLAHFLFNSLWLLAFGAPVAKRLRQQWRFLALFLLSGAAGALFFSIFHADDTTFLVGASGGVTGLLGGLVRFAFRRPAYFSPGPQPLLGIFHPTVLVWSAVIIALNVSTEFFGAGLGAGDANIAWEAHIGGYLFGLLAMPLFDPKTS